MERVASELMMVISIPHLKSFLLLFFIHFLREILFIPLFLYIYLHRRYIANARILEEYIHLERFVL